MIKMCIKVCIKIQCRKKKKILRSLRTKSILSFSHIHTHSRVWYEKKEITKKKIFYLFKSIRRQIFVFKQLEILD